MPEPISCAEIVELVTEYLEGALVPDDRTRFEEHLLNCEGCTDYLAQMRETIRVTGQLTEEAIGPSAMEALLSAFRTWKKR